MAIYKIPSYRIPNISSISAISGSKNENIASICSVAPHFEKKVILQLKKSHIRSFSPFGTPGRRKKILIIKGAYTGLGEDRQVALWMAMRDYSSPVIVIDLGTAITVDAANHQTYAGGIILPGVGMWSKSLAQGTALLPEVSCSGKATAPLLGKDTSQCIKSGLRHGLTSMLDGLLDSIERSIKKKPAVVLTGGDVDKVSPFLRHKHRVDDSLVLRGLNELYHFSGGQK